MTLPIDPSRTALPPVAQFLAEAALQRQTALLGLDKPKHITQPARRAAAYAGRPGQHLAPGARTVGGGLRPAPGGRGRWPLAGRKG